MPIDPTIPRGASYTGGSNYHGDSTTTVTDSKHFSDIIWQPPFDPQALYLPMLQGGRKLSRGYIHQDLNDPAIKNNPHGRPWGLRFLYNPTEVDVSYSLATSITPPQGGKDVYSLPIIGVPGSATLSWNLILDRTFDVNRNDGSLQSHIGIQADIRHFERMMGYTPSRPFIQPTTMVVVFGNPKTMKYFGYIQNFGVMFAQWTQDMRPYRGGLTGITMQILSTDTQKANAGKNVPTSVNVHGSSSAVTAATGTGRDGSSS